MADKLSFEDKLKKIEELTKKIQNSDSELEKAVDLYEEAMKLAKEVDATLSKLERRVEIVTNSSDDEIITEEYKN